MRSSDWSSDGCSYDLQSRRCGPRNRWRGLKSGNAPPSAPRLLWRHQTPVDAVLRNACRQQFPPVDPAVLVGIETGEAPLKLGYEFGAADAVVLVAVEVDTPRHRALAAKPAGCPFRPLHPRQLAVSVAFGDAEQAPRSKE